MSSERVHDGGCLCGSVRYQVTGTAIEVLHCHCTMCRKSAGAPIVTWANFPGDRLTYTRGDPIIYQSSKNGRRGFCSQCGSQIVMYYVGYPAFIAVTVGTFDDPAAVAPTEHVFVDTQLPWLHIDDALPRRSGQSDLLKDVET